MPAMRHTSIYRLEGILHAHWFLFVYESAPNLSKPFQWEEKWELSKAIFKNFTLGISPSVPLSVFVCAYWPPSSLLVCSGGKSVSNPSAVTTTDRPWFKACQSHSQTLRSARDARPRPIQTDLCLLQSVINVTLFLTPSSENTHSHPFMHTHWQMGIHRLARNSTDSFILDTWHKSP